MSFAKSLKAKAEFVWEQGYNHPFVQEMGKGTLSKEKFEFYLLQDYYYLMDYAKIFALGTVKATSEEMMRLFTTTQYEILVKEMELHRNYMASYGIGENQLKNVKPSLYNKTYTAYMLSIGQTGDLPQLLASVFPCMLTYYDYATRLKEDYAEFKDGNFYESWIETYSSEEFLNSFQWMYEMLDQLCENKGEEELKRIEEIFINSVEFEYLFWDMSYKCELSYLL